jgi:hypothetical protein
MRTMGRSSKAVFASYDSPPSEMKEACSDATLAFAAEGVAGGDVDWPFSRASCGGSGAMVDVLRDGRPLAFVTDRLLMNFFPTH